MTNGDLARQSHGHNGASVWAQSQVYQVLRDIAHNQMRGERADHVLQTTALVNEAYLRLCPGNCHDCGDEKESKPRAKEAPARDFYFQAARAMRHILIEEARKRKTLKRAGKDGGQRVSLHTSRLITGRDPDYQDLDEALTRLEKVESRAAQVVELRFYGGLTMSTIAKLLGVSLRTVEKDWAFARAWLRTELAAR